MYKGYPSSKSKLFRVKHCAYDLCGNDSRLDQQALDASFKHRSFLYVACHLRSNLPLRVREATNLKNFVAKLKKLKLSVIVISALIRFYFYC